MFPAADIDLSNTVPIPAFLHNLWSPRFWFCWDESSTGINRWWIHATTQSLHTLVASSSTFKASTILTFDFETLGFSWDFSFTIIIHHPIYHPFPMGHHFPRVTILKNMKVNGKDDIPYIMEKMKPAIPSNLPSISHGSPFHVFFATVLFSKPPSVRRHQRVPHPTAMSLIGDHRRPIFLNDTNAYKSDETPIWP